MIVHERDHRFTECATFADDIKTTWGAWQTPWHYMDQPYLDEPGTTIEDFPEFVIPDVDVIHAMTDLTAFLKRETDSSSSKYINQIAQYFPAIEDQRSVALRLVIHYIGDIHQPLHGVAEVDHRFPAGDQGGNSESVPADPSGSVTNLHSVWDSVIYKHTGYETLPMSEEDFIWYTEQVNQLNQAHPIDSLLIKPSMFSEWSNEGFELSISTVYEGKYLFRQEIRCSIQLTLLFERL